MKSTLCSIFPCLVTLVMRGITGWIVTWMGVWAWVGQAERPCRMRVACQERTASGSGSAAHPGLAPPVIQSKAVMRPAGASPRNTSQFRPDSIPTLIRGHGEKSFPPFASGHGSELTGRERGWGFSECLFVSFSGLGQLSLGRKDRYCGGALGFSWFLGRGVAGLGFLVGRLIVGSSYMVRGPFRRGQVQGVRIDGLNLTGAMDIGGACLWGPRGRVSRARVLYLRGVWVVG